MQSSVTASVSTGRSSRSATASETTASTVSSGETVELGDRCVGGTGKLFEEPIAVPTDVDVTIQPKSILDPRSAK